MVDEDIWMSTIIIWLCDLLLFPGVDKFADNEKLCCELIMVILHVSTFFFLRHQVLSLSRARDLDVQFTKTITSNTMPVNILFISQ